MGTPDIKRFEIIGVLGTGAQGVVVLARDHADASSEPVGLKVLRRVATDPDALTRLREEARILAWLNHPSIVRVHRLLEKDGLPIVVMEHVQGASAMELAGAGVGLPAAVAVEIAHQTAVALDAAYNAEGPDGRPMRIVHRDVKPANLLLSLDGQVKIVDFGIAITVEEEADAAAPGSFLGTPGYVAPERRSGGADTPAVDVYALGSSLYAMLSGKLLVATMSEDEHDASIARALDQLAPEGVSPDLVEDLQGLVRDMCRFTPDARPPIPVLATRLAAAVSALGAPDLKAYAASNVAPLIKKRAKTKVRGPNWTDLAFLEQGIDVQELELASRSPKRALALRPVDAPPEIEPLLQTIARRPPWQLWKPKASPDEIVAALEALRGTRDPRAVTRAYELTSHADPRIVEAAWELLASAC
ncbi:MAG: serine/threonine protein kinase [Deltaproteobacteria bacterium]|nr:serine/threonine protein kinase [Deltaproteobacteria bacterium]